MGVRNTKYIMYGVETTYDEWQKLAEASGNEDDFYEKYDLQYGHDISIGCILDGMGGEYAVWGTVLAEFDEYEGDALPTGVIDLNKIFKKHNITNRRKAEVKAGVEKILGREVKLKKLFVNHYS